MRVTEHTLTWLVTLQVTFIKKLWNLMEPNALKRTGFMMAMATEVYRAPEELAAAVMEQM